MVEDEQEIEFRWRMWTAVILTALGSFYYLVFLAYFSRGVPIEKIHTVMTDSWPDFFAEYIPLISPFFLAVGLAFWWGHNYFKKKNTVVTVPQEEYKFEFKTFNSSEEIQQKPDVDYVFKSKQNTSTDTPD